MGYSTVYLPILSSEKEQASAKGNAFKKFSEVWTLYVNRQTEKQICRHRDMTITLLDTSSEKKIHKTFGSVYRPATNDNLDMLVLLFLSRWCHLLAT